MNYNQALRYLNGFVNYEKSVPKSHAAFNLERMRHGLEALNHPDKSFFPVLIAGTVGKGSTGYFLEQILKKAGISCGYYHSPHVETIRERIRVNGAMLSEKEWAAGLSEIRAALKENPLPENSGNFTYFEILTLLGILLFAKAGLRIGIFEIGMGGRLDATNILAAPLCILTRIDLDHQKFLGNTIGAIAKEKAGVIKQAHFAVAAPQAPEAGRVFKRIAGNRLVTAKSVSFQPGLAGNFQKQNAGNAAAAAKILKEKFRFNISAQNIADGLKARAWAGRMEAVYWKGRRLLLDTAHNPAGCRALVQSLKRKPAQIIFGALSDKKSKDMLKALSPLKAPLTVTAVSNPRSKTSGELAAEARGLFAKIEQVSNSKAALARALKHTEKGDSILITGSFYLVGEIRKSI